MKQGSTLPRDTAEKHFLIPASELVSILLLYNYSG